MISSEKIKETKDFFLGMINFNGLITYDIVRRVDNRIIDANFFDQNKAIEKLIIRQSEYDNKTLIF